MFESLETPIIVIHRYFMVVVGDCVHQKHSPPLVMRRVNRNKKEYFGRRLTFLYGSDFIWLLFFLQIEVPITFPGVVSSPCGKALAKLASIGVNDHFFQKQVEFKASGVLIFAWLVEGLVLPCCFQAVLLTYYEGRPHIEEKGGLKWALRQKFRTQEVLLVTLVESCQALPILKVRVRINHKAINTFS